MGADKISDHRFETFVERAELGDRMGKIELGDDGEGWVDADENEGLVREGEEVRVDETERDAR